jgi:DUF971 family protein
MSNASNPLRPRSLKREGLDQLAIEWSDGHRSVYSWRHLRQNCPCASCKENVGRAVEPFHILTAKELAATTPLAPLSVSPVGHYAYKISWSDGHDSGIYTIEALRSLCQCAACVENVRLPGAAKT